MNANIKKAEIAILEAAQDMDNMVIRNVASFNTDDYWNERRSIIDNLNEAKAILESVNTELQLVENR
jgi:hypothetical protein